MSLPMQKEEVEISISIKNKENNTDMTLLPQGIVGVALMREDEETGKGMISQLIVGGFSTVDMIHVVEALEETVNLMKKQVVESFSPAGFAEFLREKLAGMSDDGIEDGED